MHNIRIICLLSILLSNFVITQNVSAQCVSGNCVEGQGYYSYQNGDRYLGQFLNSKPHGIGAYIFANGDIFLGQFENDQRQGKGYLYFKKSGYLYIGDYESERQVNGTFIFDNGDIYIGEFQNGKFSLGSYYYCDRGLYVGEWVKDSFHGRGKYVKPSGEKKIGTFNNGNFMDGTTVTSELEPELKLSKTIRPKIKTKYQGQVNFDGVAEGYGREMKVVGKIGAKGATTVSIGYFKHNNLHGPGVQILDGGDFILLGEFINGNFIEGLYVEAKEDQRLYMGKIDTTSNTFTGTGSLVFQGKQESYYGEFSHGAYDGKGSYFWPSGESFNGTFANVNKVEGIENFPDGEVRRVRYNSNGTAEVLERLAPPYSERSSTSGLYGQNWPKTCQLCKGVGSLWFPHYNKVVEGPNNCYTMIMPGDANWMRGYDYYIDKDCDRNYYSVSVGHYETCLTCGGDGIK